MLQPINRCMSVCVSVCLGHNWVSNKWILIVTKKKTQTQHKHTNFSRRFWKVSRSFVLSCHSKAAGLQRCLLATPVRVCQRGKKQVITVLITWQYTHTQKTQTKEHASWQDARFNLQPGREKGKRKRDTGRLTERLASGRKTKIYSHTEWQAHRGLAVVSICDNNGSNVIIGSLIKINLISATCSTFCPLKRCLSLCGCLYLASTSILGAPVTSALLSRGPFTPGVTNVAACSTFLLYVAIGHNLSHKDTTRKVFFSPTQVSPKHLWDCRILLRDSGDLLHWCQQQLPRPLLFSEIVKCNPKCWQVVPDTLQTGCSQADTWSFNKMTLFTR